MPASSLEDWVALSLLPGLGPVLLRRALERFGDPGEVAYRVPAAALREMRGVGEGISMAISSCRPDLRRRAEAEVRASERLGIRLIPLLDPGYPAALRTLHDPPMLLYVRGHLAEGIVRVAVVGSRRATGYGRRVAVGLGSGLALRGVEVVSGGARGIDTCAHEGALEGGGRTVAVLGSGFERPYPAENASLYERVSARGAVVSEFKLEEPPLPENFPRRNRLISGLSAAVVVVEAAPRSGSLTTAAHALEQGREVMAIPGPVSSEQSQGCHRLIQEGAKLVQKVADILEELSPMYASAVAAPAVDPGTATPLPDPGDLPPDEAAVLGLLDDPEPVHVDLLAEAAPFGIARLQAALFGLELRGAVEQLPGRYYLGRLRKGPEP